MPLRTNPLDSLVTAGTITSSQETAIKSAMKPQGDKGQPMENGLKTDLDKLVTAGTITQAHCAYATFAPKFNY